MAGQIVFSRMEEVVWGKPAAETIAALAQKRDADAFVLAPAEWGRARP